jgi:hypothetical protein
MMKRPGRGLNCIAIAVAFTLLCSVPAFSYSVLSHEEIVDLLWGDEIRPILLKRFPTLKEDELRETRAYAYGGAVIQDLGYYPFGSREFSNLVHYVRSGDFVLQLLKDSKDANEYAFALGALAHYTSDLTGHPTVNQAVAILNPKLKAKFGNSITFAQNKTAHVRTEFGFDVVQVAKKRYATQQYHDFIGFKVSKELLARVFPVVYGMKLDDVLPRLDLAVGSYRYAVSKLIPELTIVALKTHREEILAATPTASDSEFVYRISRADYEKEWGKDYSRPGIATRMMGSIIRVLPKIGPLKVLSFQKPTTQTEEMYVKSMNRTADQYRRFLEQVRGGRVTLPNRDLDSGKPAASAEYSLADETYADLLARLTDAKFKTTSAELRRDILGFYAGGLSPAVTGKDQAREERLAKQLDQLKAWMPGSIAAMPHSK